MLQCSMLFISSFSLIYHVDYCVFYDVKLQVLFFVQDKYYVQLHIQMNEYRDRVIMVST